MDPKASMSSFKVNASTGAISVKKGTAKGLYRLKIQVTAAGTKTYEKGTKAVIVNIKIK